MNSPEPEAVAVEFCDEMPEAWVTAVVAAVERAGWTVTDAHECAVVITLDPSHALALGAGPGAVLVIGWTERYGPDWGWSTDGAHVPDVQPLSADPPDQIARAVTRIILTGSPDNDLVRHVTAVDPAGSAACSCPIQACGAIILDPDCPDHGGRRAPRTYGHWAGSAACRTGETG
jgi:hypothetical protein